MSKEVNRRISHKTAVDDAHQLKRIINLNLLLLRFVLPQCTWVLALKWEVEIENKWKCSTYHKALRNAIKEHSVPRIKVRMNVKLCLRCNPS